MGRVCSTYGEKRNAYTLLVRNPEGFLGVGWINLVLVMEQWRFTTCFDSNESSSGLLHKRKLIGTEIICEYR
jgi:hypothetical protein